MTASTHGTRRTMTRPVVMAGIVTVGATALTLPFATTAHADTTTPGITTPTAEHTTAPTAYTPTQKNNQTNTPTEPTTNTQAERNTDGENTDGETSDKPAEKPAEPEQGEKGEKGEKGGDAGKPEHGVVDGRADGFDADTGRGEEYDQDGSLVVIPQHQQPKPEPAPQEDIDTWIREALTIMDKEGIPGTYEGIHRNLMRESAGDPLTINLWDTNAEADIPSKGLLQVIDPTFEQYHVEGTTKNIYDPVANIAAACNYAADRYGSMDNVNSAY